MTFQIRNVLGVLNVANNKPVPKGVIFNQKWPYWAQKLYDTLIGCHLAHLLDFTCVLLCYNFVFLPTFSEAKEFRLGWISKVVAFNLAVEFITYSFWHHMLYASKKYAPAVKPHKFNPTNQYESSSEVGYLSSSSGHLQREVLYTTLGFLMGSAYQVIMTHLWAAGYVPYYADFWAYPYYSVGWMLFYTYWREFHFYWIHRAMHPWWSSKLGLKDGDIGAFLYRHFHSLHHKSYNPGPWSGLSMHPVEHLIYYTCTLVPLFVIQHPLHFLYVKFHCDISPIAGHDGFADPGGDADYHYVHHAKFDGNYGVPLINFDVLFGTYIPFEKKGEKKGEASSQKQK